MNLRVWLLGLAVVAGGASAPARAADEPAAKPAGPFVVIVGAGTFDDPAIDPRPTADADAKALFDVLTDPKHLDIPADRVKLLLSAPDEKRHAAVATRDAIVRAVEEATAKTGKDDLLLLAFFGRGASASDKTVFFTPATALKDRGKTGLVMGPDLEKAFKAVKGQRVLMLMDVQFKGFKPGEEKVADPTLQDVTALLFGADDKEDSVFPPDRLLVLSGFVSAEALAKGEQGLFGSLVVDALKGAADTPPHNEGYEPDGNVTTDELVKFLEKELPNQARQLGKTEKEKQALPIPFGSRTTHFTVTKSPAAVAAKKRVDALAATAGLTDEQAKEGAALLSRMPKLKASQDLRKLYQKLADGGSTVAQLVADRATLKESLKLPAADAKAYARRVNDAIDLVTATYIKTLDAGELAGAAVKGMYRRAEEPLPPDLTEAAKNAKGLTEDQRAALLADARTRLGRREDLDETKDADLSILMMMASLNDPHTVYFDKDAVRREQSHLRGRFPGVGIQIRRDSVRDALLVVTPIKNSPAYDGGIRAGDLIRRIVRTVDSEGKPLADEKAKVTSTEGMTSDDAVKIITGKAGTPVTLVVERDGKELEFPLKRNWVSVETVLGVKRNGDADWDYMLDPKSKIGYIRLTQFTQSTFADMKAAIEDLKKQGMTGLVLDLRGNPGGFLSAAVSISELFVGPQKIVTTKPRPGSPVGREEVIRGTKKADKSFDLVVLVNGNSASASEIVAACVQDHERGVVVGDRSYGKGSVQNILPFSETGGEIKLTIARYFPPSGKNIDKLATKGEADEAWGVRPDKGFEVKLSREEQTELDTLLRDLEIIPATDKDAKTVAEEKDKQLKAAVAYLRGRAAEANKGGKGEPKN